MLRTLLSTLLALALCITITGCKKDDANGADKDKETQNDNGDNGGDAGGGDGGDGGSSTAADE